MIKNILYSELRQDLVTGDWIVIAPGRANRPMEFFKNKEKRQVAPIQTCPFEDPQKAGNEEPIIIYRRKSDWDIQVVPNKYPAVQHGKDVMFSSGWHGIYAVLPGIGNHDIVITRDHNKTFNDLSFQQASLVFCAFRERYRMFLKDRHLVYVSIFHNWGPKGGASIYHPHYQIIALPIVPPDIGHSLRGSAVYSKNHKKCVHCVMINQEKQDKTRILFENNSSIAFAPYVSRAPFELRVFPKHHRPYFEDTPDKEMESIVEALQYSLRKIKSRLNDPDYNFFIHTAPIAEKEKYSHYHWHIEVWPQIAIQAGFELSTGVAINVVDPDAAAAFLKKK